MKGEKISLHLLPKMNGRNFRSKFAAYRSDAEDEAAFEKSIEGLSEENQAIVRKAREATIARIQEIQAKMLLKEDAEKKLTELTEKYKESETALKEVNRILAMHGTTLTGLKSGEDRPISDSMAKQIADAIAEKHDQIVEALKTGARVTIFDPEPGAMKTVGTITVGSATAPDPVPTLFGAQSTPPEMFAIREDDIMSLCTRFTTNQASFPYTEAKPKDGNYAFQTAEGAAKEQIDFTTETRFASPVTLAAWQELSTQSVQDVPYLQQLAYDLLYKKHNRKKNKSILFGTGTSGENKGATLYASAFTAGSLANAIENVNIMDIIGSVATIIATTHDYEDQVGYRANLVKMSPIDYMLNFVSAKTSFGTPLYPTAGLFGRLSIGGFTIIPSEDIPVGYLFVGDMSRYNITDYVPYSVVIGRINDNLIKNKFVMLGESRFHAFVRKLDEKAFVYDTIDNIKAAITKSSTP